VIDFRSAGFAITNVSLSPLQCDHIASSLPAVNSGIRGGVRGLATHPTVLQLLRHQQLGAYVWSAVGRELVAVRVTLFDEAVGPTGWHQDRRIAVRERMNIAGFGPWASKAGVLEVEPPASVLEQMLLVCIYLEGSGADSGPLRVLPGSHEYGKLGDDEIRTRVATETSLDIHASTGALLLMRPLLVRTFSPSETSGHRRMLQIEFAPAEAISPLQWQTAIQLRRAA
jgi:hypothetical protein